MYKKNNGGYRIEIDFAISHKLIEKLKKKKKPNKL